MGTYHRLLWHYTNTYTPSRRKLGAFFQKVSAQANRRANWHGGSVTTSRTYHQHRLHVRQAMVAEKNPNGQSFNAKRYNILYVID